MIVTHRDSICSRSPETGAVFSRVKPHLRMVSVQIGGPHRLQFWQCEGREGSAIWADIEGAYMAYRCPMFVQDA